MKKEYETPEMEIIQFTTEDIMQISIAGGEGEAPGVSDDDTWN